jgi:hypothetical protein
MIGATAIQAMAQYKQGQYDQKVALNNAQLAEYERRDVIARGASEAELITREGRDTASAARAAIAAGNVEGPAVQSAVTQSLVNSALDAARVRSNAARRAWGYENEAQDLRGRAKQAKQAGILGAFGTGLSGGAQAYSAYKSSSSSSGGSEG